MHAKFETPYISCIMVTLAVALISGLTPIQTLGHMTSFGTLFAFVMASVSMYVLRIKRPDVRRPFHCPYPKIVAPLAIAICGFLIFKLLQVISLAFYIWFAGSLIFYFAYSYRKSSLRGQK